MRQGECQLILITSFLAFLKTFSPIIQAKRFRGKINIQRPKAPHFERVKFLELTKPYFISPYKDKTPIELCGGPNEKSIRADEDNPFQRIIARELYQLFESSRLIAFYHANPINAYQHFRAYATFKKQNMFLKNYGKKTMELALTGTPYETILDHYISRNMTVFSPEPNLKYLLRTTKKFPHLVLLYGVYEGKLIDKKEIEYYSSIPNLQTAQVGLVQTLDSIGGQIVSHLGSHQTTLVSQLQERIKQLEQEEK